MKEQVVERRAVAAFDSLHDVTHITDGLGVERQSCARSGSA